MNKLPYNTNVNKVEVLLALSNANNKIGELKGVVKLLPNPNVLLNIATFGEAKDSAEIENIITTYDEILNELISPSDVNNSAKEVMQYKKAIDYGFKQITEKELLNINLIIELQGIIEPNKKGLRKLPGTYIKNAKTNEVVYTPPQSEQEIMEYLDNLIEYLNLDNTYDSLINMAILHYQFEAIHPFYDGNGRTGRILNILYLVLKNKLDYPILYLSKYIINSKKEYYELMQNCNEDVGYIDDFVIYMLNGITKTCEMTIEYIDEITQNMQQIQDLMKEKIPKIYTRELVEYIFSNFYTKVELYIEKFNVTRPTATSHLKALENIGVLTSEKVGREVIYKNIVFLELLKKW